MRKKSRKRRMRFFLRVSRAYGARHGNVSCMGTHANVWTALHRRVGRVRNCSWSAWGHSLTAFSDELRAKNTFWGILSVTGPRRWVAVIRRAGAPWVNRARYDTNMGHGRGGWGSSRLRITVVGPTGSTFLIWEAAAQGGSARPKGGHGAKL